MAITSTQGSILEPFADGARVAPHEARALAKEWMRVRRRLRRACLRRAGGRRSVLVTTLKRPVWAAREALAAYSSYRPAVAERGVAPMRQILATWWAVVRYQVPIEMAYRHAVFGAPSRELRRLYLVTGMNMPQIYKIAAAVSGPDLADTLSDKRRFAVWCRSRALPVVSSVAEFANGELTRWHAPDEKLPATDLFSKWAMELGGKDTARWRFADGAYVRNGESRQLSPSQLIARVSEQARHGVVLLQPCLANHPALAPLSPHALSTVRVVTTMRRGQAPRLLAGMLRMGTGTAAADNLTQGGIAAPADLERGVLGEARRLDALGRIETYESHPDTGVRIVGTRVPFWRQVLELALRAHAQLGGLPVVGWDVAVSIRGPILLEANWNPAIGIVQVATQTPALMTELAACVLECIAEPMRRNDDLWITRAISD